jgi:glycosyltransferase involved in cell wall biosynthesis
MLIILYGEMSNKSIWKQQRMIDGGATCGYREYARNFGTIIYLAPQKVKLPWEKSIVKAKNVVKYISQYPNAVVWSVKKGPKKDKHILSKIPNKIFYYSCNAKNRNCKYSNINLVDIPERIKHKQKDKIWFKGKDPEYWKPQGQKKEFDYLLIGTRGDKNEAYFLNKLNKIKEKRRILWIGGQKHSHKVNTNHEVVYTPFVGQDYVRDNIPKAKVGILFTELKIEGFPQSFIEMTMCGLPVVYNINAPKNKFYFHEGNCKLSTKKDIVKNAEFLLKHYDSKLCRKIAIKNYSLEKSYRRILKCLK